VLAGAYLDVFKAGSVYSGVPTDASMSRVWQQAWGDLVQSCCPSYSGTYPRIQI
jgi:hypothetical protein